MGFLKKYLDEVKHDLRDIRAQAQTAASRSSPDSATMRAALDRVEAAQIRLGSRWDEDHYEACAGFLESWAAEADPNAAITQVGKATDTGSGLAIAMLQYMVAVYRLPEGEGRPAFEQKSEEAHSFLRHVLTEWAFMTRLARNPDPRVYRLTEATTADIDYAEVLFVTDISRVADSRLFNPGEFGPYLASLAAEPDPLTTIDTLATTGGDTALRLHTATISALRYDMLRCQRSVADYARDRPAQIHAIKELFAELASDDDN